MIERIDIKDRALPGPALSAALLDPGDTKAWVGIVHGYMEHGGRYAHVQEAWASRGIGSIALDLRGHGRASGRRGHCSRFEEYHDDVAELTRLLDSKREKKRVFLFGHSFGGLVCASAMLTRSDPYAALLVCDPYLKLALEVPPAKVFAARIFSRILPALSLPSGVKSEDLTHDADRIREHDADPLVFPNARARWFIESLKAQARTLGAASSLTMPLYVLVGTGDKIASPDGAREFHRRASSKDKTLDERDGLYHEVLNEPGWRPIADAMADWMLARA